MSTLKRVAPAIGTSKDAGGAKLSEAVSVLAREMYNLSEAAYEKDVTDRPVVEWYEEYGIRDAVYGKQSKYRAWRIGGEGSVHVVGVYEYEREYYEPAGLKLTFGKPGNVAVVVGDGRAWVFTPWRIYEYPPASVASTLFFVLNPEIDSATEEVLRHSGFDLLSDDAKRRLELWSMIRSAVGEAEIRPANTSSNLESLGDLYIVFEVNPEEFRWLRSFGIDEEEASFFVVVEPRPRDEYTIQCNVKSNPRCIDFVSERVLVREDVERMVELINIVAEAMRRTAATIRVATQVDQNWFASKGFDYSDWDDDDDDEDDDN